MMHPDTVTKPDVSKFAASRWGAKSQDTPEYDDVIVPFTVIGESKTSKPTIDEAVLIEPCANLDTLKRVADRMRAEGYNVSFVRTTASGPQYFSHPSLGESYRK